MNILIFETEIRISCNAHSVFLFFWKGKYIQYITFLCHSKHLRRNNSYFSHSMAIISYAIILQFNYMHCESSPATHPPVAHCGSPSSFYSLSYLMKRCTLFKWAHSTAHNCNYSRWWYKMMANDANDNNVEWSWWCITSCECHSSLNGEGRYESVREIQRNIAKLNHCLCCGEFFRCKATVVHCSCRLFLIWQTRLITGEFIFVSWEKLACWSQFQFPGGSF